MATYTTHYNLIIPDYGENNFHTGRTDYTGYYLGYDDSMNIIDATLYELNSLKNTVNGLTGFIKGDGNGNFTSENLSFNNPVAGVGATSVQTINSTSYVDITGSSVSYTPPSGATKVIYVYSCHVARQSGSATSNFGMVQLLSESSPVSGCIKDLGRTSAFLSDTEVFIFVLNAWTGSKTLKLQSRIHATPQILLFNRGYTFEGTTPSTTDVSSHYLVFSI